MIQNIIFMIYQLKKLTEKNIGFKIKNRGDCHKLSEQISTSIDEEISYNTLRRFFGLDKETKPNSKTLNILARFNGFESFADFSQLFPKQFNWYQKELAYDLMNHNEQTELVDFIESIQQIDNDSLDVIVLTIRELILANEISTLKKIFDLEILNPINFKYSELLYFCNSVGLLLRKQQTNYLSFIQTKYFKVSIFTTFVDYSSLNKNYGDFVNEIHETSSDTELVLFSGLLLQLKKILNNEPPTDSFDYLISKKLHPILLSRYISIKIYCTPKYKILEILENYKNRFIKNDSIDYVYELMIMSILSRNFISMEWITENFKQSDVIPTYYREWHYNVLTMVKLFLGIYKKNNLDLINKQFSLIEKFQPRYSYKAFHVIFLCILKYHLNIEPRSAITTYERITQEIGYEIFNLNYLTDYFES